MMYAADEFYDDDVTSGPYDDYDGSDDVAEACPHWRGPEFCDHSCETD